MAWPASFKRSFSEEDRSLDLKPGPAAALLGLVVLAIFFPYLSPNSHQVLSLPRDLSNQFLWWRLFAIHEIHQGHFPLWNPRSFCGAPYLGGFQSALFYLPNALLLFLPLAFGLNLLMALHVWAGGWFTFLWLRQRGSHPASCLLGAFMFMFSGAFVVRVLEGQISNLYTMAWIPLVFCALEGWRREFKWKWVLLGAFAVAFQVFAGHIQYVYYTGLFAGIFILYSLFQVRRKALWAAGAFLIYAGGAVLAAVQLLPGWEATQESIRQQSLSPALLTMLQMNPERLCGLFMPYFFGGWKDYWGGGYYDEGNLYVGLVGVALAFSALTLSRRTDKKFFAGAVLALNLLMVGDRTPLFLFLCKTVPYFDRFRGIGRLNILAALCWAALAALALDGLFERPERIKGWGRYVSVGSAVFFVAAALFFIAPRVGGAGLFKQYLSHADGMALSLLIAAVLLGALALLIRLGSYGRRGLWLVLALGCAELFAFAQGQLTTFNLDQMLAHREFIQKIYDRDPGDYRVWTTWGDFTLGTSGYDIWGEDPMMPARYCRFACKTQGLDYRSELLSHDFFREWTPALRLLRLRYVIHNDHDQWQVQKTNLPEVPRVYLADHWQVLPYDQVLDLTAKPDFQPLRKVLLESDPGLTPGKGPLKSELAWKDLDTDRIEITAKVSRPAVLVVSDNYSRDWKALPLADDSQGHYQVLPADGFQRGIPLLPGNHHFLLRYQPGAFRVGWMLSGAAWVVFFGCLLWFNLSRRKI